MNITIENITPFLDKPVPSGKIDNVSAWLTAVSAELNNTFGTTLSDAIAPAVYDIVGKAILRRLFPIGDPRLRAQSTGPSSAQYNLDIIGLTGWFYPGEIANLVNLFGGGGGTLSSVRTPAPNAVRFGNPYTPPPPGLNAGDPSGLGIESSDDQPEWVEFWGDGS